MTWSDGTCAYNFPINSTVTIYYQVVSLFTLVVPRLILICGTVRIIIVVMRTHRQIAAQAHSVADDVTASTSGPATITANTLRSSINIIVICVVSIMLTTPIVIYVIYFTITYSQPSALYGFAVIWMFQLNTVANSVLYLIIFRSVRMKTAAMLRDMLICIRRS